MKKLFEARDSQVGSEGGGDGDSWNWGVNERANQQAKWHTCELPSSTNIAATAVRHDHRQRVVRCLGIASNAVRLQHDVIMRRAELG